MIRVGDQKTVAATFRHDTLNESVSRVGREIVELTEEELDDPTDAVLERLETRNDLAAVLEGYKRNNRRAKMIKNTKKPSYRDRKNKTMNMVLRRDRVHDPMKSRHPRT